MYGIWNERHSAWLNDADGKVIEFKSKELAEYKLQQLADDWESKKLPGKPIYGIWYEGKWCKHSTGGIIFYYDIQVAMAHVMRGGGLSEKVKAFGENGEPVDIE